MNVVPDRAATPNYCPATEVTTQTNPWNQDFKAPYAGENWKEWGIRPGRELKVLDCEMRDADEISRARDDKAKCMTPAEMKAAYPGQVR